MRTRELFRAAADWVARHAPTDPTARPAFITRAGEPPASAAAAGSAGAAPSAPAAQLRTASALAAAIRAGEITASAALEDALARIARGNRELRAFTSVQAEAARARAAELDAARRRGHLAGPLHGVPLSVKDVIDVAGVPTTASSRVTDGQPAVEDACAVARLRAAGAILVGKTETHEFALGVTTPQSRNPWDPARIPGGSTGGSAIAAVTGMAPAGLGTDTRASIRVPAALSGAVGFKPTFGLVPTHGVLTLSWSMDHVAPIGASVADVALLLDVIAGRDPRDPASLDGPGGPYATGVGAPVAGRTVGVPAAGLEGAHPDVARAFARALEGLRAAGVRVVTVAEPTAEDLEMTNAAGMIVSRVEAATLHAPYLRDRADRYTEETRSQLEEAAQVPGTVYVAAQRLREAFRLRMAALLSGVDALALPTTLVAAPRAEEAEAYLLVLSRNCIPWSFIGVPAISVPCGRTREGLPVGLQLVSAAFTDAGLLSLAAAAEGLALGPGAPPSGGTVDVAR